MKRRYVDITRSSEVVRNTLIELARLEEAHSLSGFEQDMCRAKFQQPFNIVSFRKSDFLLTFTTQASFAVLHENASTIRLLLYWIRHIIPHFGTCTISPLQIKIALHFRDKLAIDRAKKRTLSTVRVLALPSDVGICLEPRVRLRGTLVACGRGR